MVATVTAKKLPSLLFNNREAAEEQAKHLPKYVDVCFVEYDDKGIGYGLYDCECKRLLEASDFIYQWF